MRETGVGSDIQNGVIEFTYRIVSLGGVLIFGKNGELITELCFDTKNM